jgi:hypothetical protein
MVVERPFLVIGVILGLILLINAGMIRSFLRLGNTLQNTRNVRKEEQEKYDELSALVEKLKEADAKQEKVNKDS